MKKDSKVYNTHHEVVDYLSLIVSSIVPKECLDKTTLKIGKWAKTVFYPQPYDFKVTNEGVFFGKVSLRLPICKNMSKEFIEKLKMLAAHEAGHVAYTYIHPSLNIFSKEVRKDKKLNTNVQPHPKKKKTHYLFNGDQQRKLTPSRSPVLS